MLLEMIAFCVLSPGQWPQFRGPNADGHVVGKPTPSQWSDTKNVAWKIPIPGLGWSSPVLGGGKVFLTTAVPQGAGLSLRTMALDAKTGTVVWDREVKRIAKAPSIHIKNSHASPHPSYPRELCLFILGPLAPQDYPPRMVDPKRWTGICQILASEVS